MTETKRKSAPLPAAPRNSLLNTHPKQATRIILALDAAARTSIALDMVRCMTAGGIAELLGVFVEDMRLLEHARSRLAREVLLSGVERPLDAKTLSRQIRAQSQRVRGDFEAAARKLGLPHSFRFARGEGYAELVLHSTGTETLVITAATSGAARAAWQPTLDTLLSASLRRLLFAREGWQTGRTVLALVEDPSDMALSVARRIAEQSQSPIALILFGAAAADPKALRGVIDDADTPKARASIAAVETEIGPATLVASVKRTSARLVIIPWKLAAGDPELIGALLNQTNSSVLLLK